MARVLPVPTEFEQEPARYLDEQHRQFAAAIDEMRSWFQIISENLVYSIHFGAYITAPKLSDITIGWTDLVNYDALTWSTERGGSFSLFSGRFRFDLKADVFLSVSGVVAHNELNQERSYYLRLYNHTTASPGVAIRVPVSRNVTGSMLKAHAGFSVPQTAVGNDFGLQIGDADGIFTDVVIEDLHVAIFSVGVFVGDLTTGAASGQGTVVNGWAPPGPPLDPPGPP